MVLLLRGRKAPVGVSALGCRAFQTRLVDVDCVGREHRLGIIWPAETTEELTGAVEVEVLVTITIRVITVVIP